MVGLIAPVVSNYKTYNLTAPLWKLLQRRENDTRNGMTGTQEMKGSSEFITQTVSSDLIYNVIEACQEIHRPQKSSER